MGKSTLVGAAMDAAAEQGMRVLSARGSELERSYPYGMVLDLIRPLVAATRRPDGLLGPASLVRPLFARQGGGSPLDPMAVMQGLYWIVLEAMEDGPLLLALDDAHRADDDSLRFVHYLAQRLDELAIVVVLGVRAGDPGAATELTLLTAHRVATVLQPAPLSREGVAEIVAERVGTHDERIARRCFDLTRGNPFFVHELLRGEDVQARAADGGGGTVVPDSVRRSVAARLGRLGDGASRLAAAVVVLGDGTRSQTAAALVGLDTDEATAAAAGLVAAGVFEAGGGMTFLHPIVRASVEAGLSSPELGRMHLGAARQLAAEERPAEMVAAHLLHAERGGDPWTVDRLDLAARAATARGSPRAALQYLSRAVEEPPPRYRRAEVLMALGRAEAEAGLAAEAAGHFSRALPELPAGTRRAEGLHDLGLALMRSARWEEAGAAFDEALVELGSPQTALAADLQAGSVNAALMSGKPSEETARRLSRILRGPFVTPAERHLACSVAFQRSAFVIGDRDEQLALARRGLEGAPMRELLAAGQSVELAAAVLLAADELDEEIEMLSSAMAEAQATGHLGRYCTASYCRAWPNLYAGRLADAAADAQTAVDGLPLGWETFYPAACSVLALALVELGDLDGAERALEIDPDRWAQTLDFQFLVPAARAVVLLARGRAAEAAEAAASADAVATRQGMQSPVIMAWRAPYAIALARLGQRERAIEVATADLEVAQRWGAGRTLGVALRTLGVVEGGARGIEDLVEAVAALETSPSVLELAHAQVELGAALRRGGRPADARPILARGLDAAHRIGAVLLEEQARQELGVAGARPRRAALTGPESLTPAELRVARLAAAGGSNREIAQRLFVTPKAVQFHLGNAYRKLAIESRRELEEALAG
ncbi:MAG: ATP-binding protein [Candidatus Limnocylindria bacterium]